MTGIPVLPETAPSSVLSIARSAARQALGEHARGHPMFAERVAHDIAAAVYPVIAAAERERLAAVIPAADFRKLADWFDTDDLFKETMFPGEWPPGSRGDAWQRNLRRFADLIGDPDA